MALIFFIRKSVAVEAAVAAEGRWSWYDSWVRPWGESHAGWERHGALSPVSEDHYNLAAQQGSLEWVGVAVADD
jgi:hypothetical protein